MNDDQYKVAVAILKQYYKIFETIDDDVLSKLKAANISVIDTLRALRTVGIDLGNGKKILSVSKYYSQSYQNSESLTQSLFDALVELSKTDDSITLTENGVSIDLTRLREDEYQ